MKMWHFTYRGGLKEIKNRSIGLVLGLLLAFGFHTVVLINLDLHPFILKILLIILYFLLGIGCFLSESLQCVGLICVTMFFSKSGRRTLQGLIFAYLLAGPVQNMIHNSRELTRTFGCSVELTYNLTKEYSDLMIAPFKHAIAGTKEEDADEITAALKDIDKQIAPIKKELGGDPEMQRELQAENDYVDRMQGNSLRSKEIEQKYAVMPAKTEGEMIEKKYMKNVEIECQGMISRSVERCKNSFQNSYGLCKEKLSYWVSWAICWVMKVTFVCDIITLLGGDSACNIADDMEPGFGEGYDSLNNAGKNIENQIGHVNLHYQVPKQNIQLDVQDAASSMMNVMAEVQVKMDSAQLIMLCIRRALFLLFLPIIVRSVKYVNAYLSHPGHDNVYLTARFKQLDAKRVAAGRHPTLLPLRNDERKRLVNVWSPLAEGPERRSVLGPILKQVVLILIGGSVLAMDWLVSNVLHLVAEHGLINYRLSGHNVVHILVRGNGFVANIYRSMTKSFNTDKYIDKFFTNEPCLPHPQTVETFYVAAIGLLYLGLTILVLINHVPTRLRRWICAYYFPKREKKRTLHLYNALLKLRWNWRERAAESLKSKAAEFRRKEEQALPVSGVWTWLCNLLPSCWTCALCGRKQKCKERWRQCEGCPSDFHLCPECWNNLGDSCPVCEFTA